MPCHTSVVSVVVINGDSQDTVGKGILYALLNHSFRMIKSAILRLLLSAAPGYRKPGGRFGAFASSDADSARFRGKIATVFPKKGVDHDAHRAVPAGSGPD
jgi:hypothetical protein